MKNTFSKVEQEFKGAPPIAAAVFNASSQLRRLSRPIAQMSALCERMRALSMSIAREYSPKGMHTAHVIDTDFTKKWTKDMSAEATIAPI